MKILFVLFLITGTALSAGAQWVQLGNDIDGIYEQERSGTSVKMNGDGSIILIGAPENCSAGIFTGQVRAYTYDNGSWVQLGNAINGDTIYAEIGKAISISLIDTVIAYGTPQIDSGYVRIYKYSLGNWQQIGNKLVGSVSMASFGNVICLNGDGTRIAVRSRNSSYGVVQVFAYDSIGWIQIGGDIIGEDMNDGFGNSICLNYDGSVAVIGAPNNDDNGNDAGHARIFQYDNGNWVQLGSEIDGEASSNLFGYSVSINSGGNIVAIGAPGNSDIAFASGKVRIYSFDGNNWVQMGSDINGVAYQDQAGKSVSLDEDGDRVIVGSPYHSSWSGIARIFEFTNNDWEQLGSDIEDNDVGYFGYSVDICSDGNIVAIGAPEDSYSYFRAGQTRVFEYYPNMVEKSPIEKSIIIIPNPVNDKTIIQGTEIRNITLTDLSGKELLTIPCTGSKTELDVSGLARGVYIVKVVTEKGVVSEKVVLQ